MIPESFIENWRANAKWQTISMVEQDLIISRALVCLYNDPKIKDSLVFRGGTALHKLFIKPPARYSEDIDFVQRRPEPIGSTLEVIREILNPWLGNPKWKLTERCAKLIYQYQSINGFPSKLKIEINTTERLQVLPLRYEPFTVESEWFNETCEIATYELPELMATKLRALYQRRKGRDLFDLWYVLRRKAMDVDQIINIFQKYCANDGLIISKELFQKNLELKKLNKDFQSDMKVLLSHQTYWDFDEAFNFVQNNIIGLIR